tara:strand:+ start:8648 stop:9235 length:588 start_codon:yes stop_codon:yes gene_type:complete
MKSKFVIIEGPDRVGKDTQQDMIIKNSHNKAFHKLHYTSVPFKGEAAATYSARMYTDMFNIMSALKDKNINIIFNRSHLGESIYAPLYRGYSGDYVFDIERRYASSLRENLYLITLVNDTKTLIERDDGNSLYDGLEESLRAEIDGFTRAHRKSKIKNKLLLNVGSMTAFEVSTVIKDFLQTTNTVLNNQLNLDL